MRKYIPKSKTESQMKDEWFNIVLKRPKRWCWTVSMRNFYAWFEGDAWFAAMHHLTMDESQNGIRIILDGDRLKLTQILLMLNNICSMMSRCFNFPYLQQNQTINRYLAIKQFWWRHIDSMRPELIIKHLWMLLSLIFRFIELLGWNTIYKWV